MHIKVYNGDFLDLRTILTEGVRGRQRDIIYETESVWARFTLVVRMEGLTEYAGVMAGRPSRTERIPAFSRHYLVYSFYGSACWYQRGLPGLLRGDRVLIVKVSNDFIASPLQLCYTFHHFLDVVEVMDFENVGDFRSLLYVMLQDDWWWRRAAT